MMVAQHHAPRRVPGMGTRPPQSRVDGLDPLAGEDRVVAEAGDDQRPVPLPEPLQGRQVHMVVMIVADDDEMDARQILEADAGRAHPRRPTKEKGEARSDQIGSVRMLRPSIWTSTVAWPIQVTRISSPATAGGGTDGVTGALSGQKRALAPQPAVEEALRIEPRRLARAGVEEARGRR